MKIWKDKDGNKLTFKEFIARWKTGLETVNPYQQTVAQLTATKIMLLGVLIGLIVTIVNYKTGYWMAIILSGALLNTSVQYIGLKQKEKTLKQLFNDEDAIEYNSTLPNEEVVDKQYLEAIANDLKNKGENTLIIHKDSNELEGITGGKNITLSEIPEEVEEIKEFKPAETLSNVVPIWRDPKIAEIIREEQKQ